MVAIHPNTCLMVCSASYPIPMGYGGSLFRQRKMQGPPIYMRRSIGEIAHYMAMMDCGQLCEEFDKGLLKKTT